DFSSGGCGKFNRSRECLIRFAAEIVRRLGSSVETSGSQEAMIQRVVQDGLHDAGLWSDYRKGSSPATDPQRADLARRNPLCCYKGSMMDASTSSHEVTRLLGELNHGNRQALDSLMPL